MDKKIIFYTIFFAIVTTLLLFSLFHLRHLGHKKDENILVVGTSPDYPPYTFIDIKTGHIIGFDIDVAREVSNRLGKKMVIKDMPFPSLVFDLFSRKIDMIAAGLTPTERKAKNVHFSTLYMQADPLIVLTKKDGPRIETVQELSGKKVVVNTGYTADLYLSDKQGIDLRRLKSPADSFMALKSGAVDAFVAAKSSLIPFLEKKDAANQFTLQTLPDTGDSYALAIHKQNDRLLQQVNNALEAMQKDGTLESLTKKWKLA